MSEDGAEEESLAAICLTEFEDLVKCFPRMPPGSCPTSDRGWDSCQFPFKEALKKEKQVEKVAS